MLSKSYEKTSGELTFSRGETTLSWGETTLSWGETTSSWGETTWGETDLGRNDRNSTSHDESPARSESPSDSSGSGSERVNKRWEATEVKILISVYKDHHEGKKSVREKICDTFTEHCKAAGIGSSRS